MAIYLLNYKERPGLRKALDRYIELLNKRAKDEDTEYRYHYKVMRTRIRVYRNCERPGYDSVYCFIDDQGNVLFPADWYKPSRHKPVRGNIFNADPLKGSNVYSINYLV